MVTPMSYGAITLCRLVFETPTREFPDSAGDELKLKHTCSGPQNKAWQGVGVVIKLDEASEEVLLIPSVLSCLLSGSLAGS